MKKWIKRIALGVVVVLVIALVGVTIFYRSLPTDDVSAVTPAELSVAEEVVGETASDSLSVRITDDEEPRIAIEADGQTVFENQPGRSFLVAGRGSLDIEEYRGYFWPHTTHFKEFDAQSIDAIEASGPDIELRGTLSADANQVGWTATLTATDAGVALDAQVVEAEVAGEVAEGTKTPDVSLALVSGRTDRAGVHGFGEQYTDFDLDGRLLPIMVREQGVGRGEQPLTFLANLTNRNAGGTEKMTYAAWSSFVTDDLRGVRLDPALPESHAFAVADTRTEDRVTLEVWAPRVRALLTAGDSPSELVAAQGAGTERPVLADWSSRGAVLGLQGGTEEVRSEIESLQAAGTEISGVWLQDWTGQRTTSFGDRLWWTWQLDEDRYPGWSELVADLNDQDIKVTSYVNPFLVDAAPKQDDSIRNLFAEADEQDFLVTDEDGEPYPLDQGQFDAFLVDLTNPEARAWYADIIATEVLGEGVDGFMADFGEGLPIDGELADGNPVYAHNQWPALWAQTVREACDRADKPDCVAWFRSGSLGMDADAPVFWNGDQNVTFSAEDGLASALLGTFSSGVSGWPLAHSDTGGYTSVNAIVKDYVRTRDLLARWAEYEAFGVLMRTHEGNRPDPNLQVASTDQTREDFARMTRVYAALGDYRRRVVEEAAATGVPAIRHPWLMAPGSAAAEADTAFYFGDAIFVAPVLSEGTTEVTVTLPPGEWEHLFTGETYNGDEQITVDAPLGVPAAFVDTTDADAEQIIDSVRDSVEER